LLPGAVEEIQLTMQEHIQSSIARTVRGKTLKGMQDYPLYSIGVVSELLDIHPETIRLWERSGIVQPPQRRSGKRFYSERDFQ